MAAKKKIVNIYFRVIGRKVCMNCREHGITQYSFGAYSAGKWRQINYLCERCFQSNSWKFEPLPGYETHFQGYGGTPKPDFIPEILKGKD